MRVAATKTRLIQLVPAACTAAGASASPATVACKILTSRFDFDPLARSSETGGFKKWWIFFLWKSEIPIVEIFFLRKFNVEKIKYLAMSPIRVEVQRHQELPISSPAAAVRGSVFRAAATLAGLFVGLLRRIVLLPH